MELFITLVFILFITVSIQIIIDSWAKDDFDESHNCEDDSLMKKLKSDHLRCAVSNARGNDMQLQKCKKKLTYNLIEYCPIASITVQP